MKRNLIRMSAVVLTVLFSAVTTFAQTQSGAAESSWSSRGLAFIAVGIGMGLAAGLCGIGQGKIAAAACEGMARNPSAYNRVQLALFVGLAFVETLVLFTFVLLYIKTPNL